MLDQNVYRLIMHVEGHCGWSDRLKFMLFMQPSCVVLQESFCREWYSEMLLPWIHYIPTDYHFETLENVVTWGLDEANKEIVDRIVTNKVKYATIVLSEYGILRYTLELLNGYTKLGGAGDVRRREGGEEASMYLKRTHDLAQIVIPPSADARASFFSAPKKTKTRAN